MNNQNVTNVKVKYEIDKKSFFGHSAILLMALAAVFRFIGCWGMWNNQTALIMHIILPIVSCLLLMLCVMFLGKKGFFLSCIPVILGVVFFIYKAFSFDSKIQLVLCILLYIVVAVLYTGTVIGSIHTKWLLPPLFGIPFLYHVFVEDIPALNNAAQPVTFADGMQEMSVLCIMAALFFVGLGLKKKLIETIVAGEPVVTDTAPVSTETAVDAAPEEEVPAADTGAEPMVPAADFEPSHESPSLTLESQAQPLEAITPEAEAKIAAEAAEKAEIVDAEFEKA